MTPAYDWQTFPVTIHHWISGARPRTLPAAFAPVLAGTSVAAWEASIKWLEASLALAVAVALQIGVNYANDYSDGIRGTDEDRVGPMRLVASGAASPQAVKFAALSFLGIGAVCGFFLSALTSWWLLLIGLVAILAAWGYTGGSKPYGYRALGEISVFVFFGLVAVIGTSYVQTLNVSLVSVLAGVGIGALACAILVANNLRDIPTDILASKRTLAVVLGEKKTRYFFIFLIVVAFAMAAVIARLTSTWAMAAFIAVIPAAMAGSKVLGGARGLALVEVLKLISMTELLWAIGLAAGLLFAA